MAVEDESPSLIGRTLGSYRMLALLGAGGMGKVYRAHDTRLGRDVAIKVLPTSLAHDPERLARFEREARFLAALNHPHIAAIYGFEDFDGVHALVLELVEGRTLADRVAAGPIPVNDALPIARQITDALEAAHEKGIIHRDLKPANIKITPAGAVKVLDFGLAKALAGNGASPDLSQLPTGTAVGTREGVILGTVAYMSPEQARGQAVDKRTDIWAFGCVLFEMLTGDAAFASRTLQDTLAAVLRAEPAWNRLPSDTPVGIRRLLKRCLEKDPGRRLQAIGDARVELEDLLAGKPEETPTTVALAPARTRLVPWAVVAVLLIIVGLSLWTRGRDQLQPQPPPTRLDLVLPAGAPMAPGGSLALSADGRRLVYVAQVGGQLELYLREMSTGATRAIPGTRGARAPFFSPDGEWVGFFAEGKLKKVSVAGGEPVVLAEAPLSFGGAWGPDDTIYFNAHEGEGLFRISASGGQVQPVTGGQDVWPDILPDGHTLLFTGARTGAGAGVYSLRNGEIRRILSFGSYARYVPTGHLVYGEVGKLLAVPFDAAALEVTGPPVTLFEDVRTAARGFGVASFALSQGGVLVYAPGQDAQFASLAWVDRQGMIEPLGLEAGIFGTLSLSPDGKQVAVPIFEGASSDIWLYDIARGTRTRFTYGQRQDPRANINGPRWTPDGKHIVYTSLDLSSRDDEVPKFNFFWKPADGSREAVELLTTDDLRRITGDASRLADPDSFSPDGSFLTFFSWSPETGFDLWLLRLDRTDPYVTKPPKPEPFVRTRFGEAFGRFSPDGRWIAYMSNESGQYEVYVRPYPGPGPRIQISTDGGIEALWHPSGRQLFYRSGARYFAVDVRLTPAFEVGKPQLLFETPSVDIPGFELSLSPDGERILIVHNPERRPQQTLTVITNFFDALRRRIATGK